MANINGGRGARRDDAGRTSTTSNLGSFVRVSKRAEPTEPEVPSAKRVHALHRQRSTLVAAAAVTGLFVLVLVLLYKTGRKITALPASAKSFVVNAARPKVEVAPLPTAASAGTAAAAPSAKASAQSPTVFRKPPL
jgi:hypothetical protein